MYAVNEIFYSLQGEGVRAGTANVFVRFAGCNLTCNGTIEGEAYAPVCDTEFVSGMRMSAADVCQRVSDVSDGRTPWVICTGGEPSLQLDDELVAAFHDKGWKVAIETNGTKELVKNLDWITVSPKTAEHALNQLTASEVKYVRHHGQGIPKTSVKAEHKLISPAFDHRGMLTMENLEWCVKLVKENPKWRLSVQQHKSWKVR